MSINFQEILKELEYRVEHGIIDLTKEEQVTKLVEILKENGVSDANEMAQKARVYFSYINEAGKKQPLEKVLAQKFVNPDTGREVTVASALGYEKKSKAYGIAQTMMGNAGYSKNDIDMVDAGPDDDEKPAAPKANVFGKGKGGKVFDKPEVEKKPKTFKELQIKAKEVSNKVYGQSGKGSLLQKSQTSDAALKGGYVEGAWWVAPGNAGSNFNENMSDEAACILQKYPQLEEDELAMVIFNKSKGTALGKQQKDVAIRSENKIKIPEGMSKEDAILYKNSVISARSGRAKWNRISASVESAQKQVGFGNKIEITGHGGTSRKAETPKNVMTDRDNINNKIDKSKRCFIRDAETGKVVEVPKEVLKQWVASSGGGENAADTVVIATDERGNLMYDGWSDKKTLADLQANSTLNNDMTRAAQRVDDAMSKGLIDAAGGKKAKQLILAGQKEIAQIEKGYKLVSQNNAKYFLSLKPSEIFNIEKEVSKDGETAKHYSKYKDTFGKVLKGQGKADSKSVAIAEEVSGVKRKKSKEELQAEKYVSDTLDLYGEEDIKSLMKNPDVPDDVKSQVEKANKAGAVGRKQYIEWFNGEWLKDKKNKSKIANATPFVILCNVSKNNPQAVSTDERKIIERAAIKQRKKLADSGKQVPPTLKSVEKLSALRQQALEKQRMVFKTLEKLPAKTATGKKTTVGALLGFEDAKDALHLDKIDLPKNDKDYHQYLKRNTHLAMEGIEVTPQKMKECLGVKNTQELQDNFVVGFDDERYVYSDENPKIVTGKVVALYMIDKDGKRREISPKAFRSKQGLTGSTSNTLAWSTEMQKCFDSKR